MAQSAMSGFDRRSLLSTRTHPQFSAPWLTDCFRSVVAESTLSVRVTGYRRAWYLQSSSISNATIDDIEYSMFLFEEHPVTLDLFVEFARQRSRWHNRMPRLVPSPAPPTCVADTFDQVESDAVQTCLG
eukprot:5362945-Pyramimonas_sp.AAC.1